MENKKTYRLITHNGAFHADDVFAASALTLLLEKKGGAVEIIRTRDEEIIKTGDYVFDVGRLYNEESDRFDHHQKEGAGERENGIPYSSFGLVWKKFGADICGLKETADRVDKRLVQPIDANDNGFNLYTPTVPSVAPYGIYDVIFTFHPGYKEENPDFDSAFMKAVAFARNLLLKEIQEAKDQEEVHQYLAGVMKGNDSKIVILDEYVPREKIWFELTDYSDVLFAVAPREVKKETWKAIALPKQKGLFGFRKPLPAAWGGLKDEELQKVTGVSDAVFAHRALFMAITKTKEGAKKLAELALKE